MDILPATTEYIIDKITYIVTAHESETAVDTLKQKIEKLIIRDLRKTAENTGITTQNTSKND